MQHIHTATLLSYQVLKIDVSDDSTSLLNPTYSGSYKWRYGATAWNGITFMSAGSYAQHLRLNTGSQASMGVGTSDSTGGKWYGMAMGSNGLLYTVPYKATQVQQVDPAYATARLTFTTAGTYQVQSPPHGPVHQYCAPVLCSADSHVRGRASVLRRGHRMDNHAPHPCAGVLQALWRLLRSH